MMNKCIFYSRISPEHFKQIMVSILFQNFSMKKHHLLIILAPYILLIMGCPVDTKFPLASPGTEKIDKALIGTWENKSISENPDVIKVKISKKDANTYSVEVLDKGSMYMADTTIFEGFVTKLEGKDFFYVRPIGTAEKYYLYHYRFEGGKLKTFDVGLKVGGIDAVTSTEAFRNEVSSSLKMEDCLTGEFIWEKL